MERLRRGFLPFQQLDEWSGIVTLPNVVTLPNIVTLPNVRNLYLRLRVNIRIGTISSGRSSSGIVWTHDKIEEIDYTLRQDGMCQYSCRVLHLSLRRDGCLGRCKLTHLLSETRSDDDHVPPVVGYIAVLRCCPFISRVFLFFLRHVHEEKEVTIGSLLELYFSIIIFTVSG